MDGLEIMENNNYKAFEDIKHIDENGVEFWYARELQIVLKYSQWRRFENVIDKAKKSFKTANLSNFDDFADIGKIVKAGATSKEIKDYKLSRYACYLVVMNGDVSKPIIALGQSYFAIQTRKQELLEQKYEELREEQQRMYKRNKTKRGNAELNQVANNIGVKNFDKFHNAGYRGLYNGESADDIAKRKGLRYREDILDNMGSVELSANEFRITQTGERLKKGDIQGDTDASQIHNKIGKIVRNAIKEAGSTMPEDLPTPPKSLKQLEKDNKRKLKKK